MGKPTRSTKNEPLGCKYLLLCVSKLEVFTQLPPAPGGALPYMGYIGMCRCEGYGFMQFTLG